MSSLPSHLLTDALALAFPCHVALVGAGGKTSLMFGLAGELFGTGCRVITGTTTKIALPGPEDTPLLLTREARADFSKSVIRGLDRHRHVTIGDSVMPGEGKVRGCGGEVFDRLFQAGIADGVIVECDGARGRPIKAPREKEPVVPASATHVVGVMGLDAVGKPIDDSYVFQPELLGRITGQNPGDRVSPRTLYNLAAHEKGLFKGARSGARRVVFLNKRDLLAEKEVREVVETLTRLPFPARIVWGSLRPAVVMQWRDTGPLSPHG